MDYCEIILDTVRRVVRSDIYANETGQSLESGTIIQILADYLYTLRSDKGSELVVQYRQEPLQINDRVLYNGSTVMAKILDQTQMPITVLTDINDFVSYEKHEGQSIAIENDDGEYNCILVERIIGNSDNSGAEFGLNIIDDYNTYRFEFLNDNNFNLQNTPGILQQQIYKLQNLGHLNRVEVVSLNDESIVDDITISIGKTADIVQNELGLTLFSVVEEYPLAVDE